ncbi:acyltransferase family protein [Larkinella insperata]|uniref:Acyltransferase family protein n=1 Tax=Larkinella insperata TaxID=332158 RepID=A0ABW3Q9T4_9BACT|nr:heparan-alpha-glucosaminide N-acetyltransferase domain-containing protein [Larkinella insperata]
MEPRAISPGHNLNSDAHQRTGQVRLLSLDTFRGLTVAAMILVNNPGDWGHIYAPLEHAHWHGWTPTDLIFPFFLFIVGVSIAYALPDKTRAGLAGKIAKRSLILFGLGLFLNLFPKFDFSTVRIPGVLQRIALVYLATSLLYIKTATRTQGWLIGGLLVGYWLIMAFVPVPDFGPANLEPETNLGAWLDRTVLGGHLWKTSRIWDPEGLLSTLPAIATGLSGILAGTLLKSKRPEAEKAVWLFVAGCLALLGAYVWNGFFPINKSLWTSSFVLLTSGLALQALALCFWLIDVQGYRKWTKPFVAFGVNAITVFFLSGLIPRVLNMIRVPQPDGSDLGAKEWLYQTFFVPYFASPYNASLAGALTFVLIWFVILYGMYQKKIIIKV